MMSLSSPNQGLIEAKRGRVKVMFLAGLSARSNDSPRAEKCSFLVQGKRANGFMHPVTLMVEFNLKTFGVG